MKPTIGRIVIYNTTEEDKLIMKKLAAAGHANIQDTLPAIITAVWSDTCVNLNVQLDGFGSLWRTSSLNGDQAGQWQWPVIIAKNVNTGEETQIDINKKVGAPTPEAIPEADQDQAGELTAKVTSPVEVEIKEEVTAEQASTRPKRTIRDLKTN